MVQPQKSLFKTASRLPGSFHSSTFNVDSAFVEATIHLNKGTKDSGPFVRSVFPYVEHNGWQAVDVSHESVVDHNGGKPLSMVPFEKVLCPELELRYLPFDDSKLSFTKESSIDLLAIHASGSVLLDEKGLTYAALRGALGQLSQQPTVPVSALRVLFINTSYIHSNGTPALSLEGAKYLYEKLGVSPAFIAAVTSRRNGIMTTSRCRWRRNTIAGAAKEGECIAYRHSSSADALSPFSLEGWYSYTSSLTLPTAFVWFSYDKSTATYVVTGCDRNGVQESVETHLKQHHAKAVVRPLAIDCIIAEAVANSWSMEISERRELLASYEASVRRAMSTGMGQLVRELHMLSYNLIIIGSQISDSMENLTFLLDLYKALGGSKNPEMMEYTSLSHSLSFLLSQAGIRERRLSSYTERTHNVINLIYHLSSQSTAEATGRIAVETQRDSSSMITMAALTMLFLPSTFIAALFSMDFFAPVQESSPSGTDNPGSTPARVMWWLYPAISIPLTALVFGVWLFWRSRRMRRYKDWNGIYTPDLSRYGHFASNAQNGTKSGEAAPLLPFVSPTANDVEVGERMASGIYAAQNVGTSPIKAGRQGVENVSKAKPLEAVGDPGVSPSYPPGLYGQKAEKPVTPISQIMLSATRDGAPPSPTPTARLARKTMARA
ncbi:hypothetical protein NMY22_g7903 [Coprinellus aureogranulatus]|nr:hypothetical protein NMY22_g7903 [Coprinellus aureogranulatus]